MRQLKTATLLKDIANLIHAEQYYLPLVDMGERSEVILDRIREQIDRRIEVLIEILESRDQENTFQTQMSEETAKISYGTAWLLGFDPLISLLKGHEFDQENYYYLALLERMVDHILFILVDKSYAKTLE